MMIVEAKTINWAKREGKGQETTVKLDSLTKLYGGEFAKGLLVTFFPLTDRIISRIHALRNIESEQLCGFDQLVDCFSNWRKSTI